VVAAGLEVADSAGVADSEAHSVQEEGWAAGGAEAAVADWEAREGSAEEAVAAVMAAAAAEAKEAAVAAVVAVGAEEG
jgi:hypothetical protein